MINGRMYLLKNYSYLLLCLVFLQGFFSYAVLSVDEQAQRKLSIDEIISSIKQKFSEEEYGRHLYEKALYYMGDKERFERNLSVVIGLLQESSWQNYPPALRKLASLYENGQGVPRSLSKAVQLYNQAVQLGYAPAMTDLAYLYENGKGVPRSLSGAVQLYNQAVQLEYAPAMVNLAYLYEHGKGVSKDVSRAIELYNQAVQLGYAPAMTALAHLYKRGKGVPKDVSRAVELYAQAVQFNYVPAMASLAYLYEHEKGIPQNVWKEKSIELLQQARKEGSSASSAKEAALAYIYFHGVGLSVDYVTAKKWVDLAMDKHLSGLSSDHRAVLLILRTSIYSHFNLNVDENSRSRAIFSSAINSHHNFFDEDPSYLPSREYVQKFLRGPARREALRRLEQNCQNTMRER